MPFVSVLNFKAWDINRLRAWLHQSSTQEDDNFDLKEKIPEDEPGKIRLKKEFCGFANHRGGCLLFGIDRDKRIIGVEKDGEFVTRLGQIITTHITPATIVWDLHECIDLESHKRCVYVVRIHESPLEQKPHVFYKEGEGLSIPLRINGSIRYLTRGDEIRKLVLSQDRFYLEYGMHVVDILNKIKGQLEPSFSLWETTICMGFKSYCRSIGTEKGNSFSVALEDIERKAANLKKSIIVASTEGTEPTDVQDREQLKKAIDAFVDGYQMMMI
jgi:hypothetical protein